MNNKNQSEIKEHRAQSSSPDTTTGLSEEYNRLLERLGDDQSLREDLYKLKRASDSGLRAKWWGRRFMFGFGVGKAIDQWWREFDKTDPEDTLINRIPRNETSNVVAKWLWFGFFSAVSGVLLSLSIAAITAYFLYKQTEIFDLQTELLTSQTTSIRDNNISTQRMRFNEILFAENCSLDLSVVNKNTENSNEVRPHRVERVCTPMHNSRARGVAFRAMLQLERMNEGSDQKIDLRGAHLSGVVLSDIDLSNTNLARADFTNAKLTGIDFSGAMLVWANFEHADLSHAKLNNTFSWGANFRDANLSRTDLSGAFLGAANLTSSYRGGLRDLMQDQLDTACGNYETLLPERLSIKECDLTMNARAFSDILSQ